MLCVEHKRPAIGASQKLLANRHIALVCEVNRNLQMWDDAIRFWASAVELWYDHS